VQRIKGEGDYDLARALLTPTAHFDPALRDESSPASIVCSCRHTGFVMPTLEPSEPGGEIDDAISYPLSI
jgi:hypothetical protein